MDRRDVRLASARAHASLGLPPTWSPIVKLPARTWYSHVDGAGAVPLTHTPAAPSTLLASPQALSPIYGRLVDARGVPGRLAAPLELSALTTTVIGRPAGTAIPPDMRRDSFGPSRSASVMLVSDADARARAGAAMVITTLPPPPERTRRALQSRVSVLRINIYYVTAYAFGFLTNSHFYHVPHFDVARRSLRRNAKISLICHNASQNPPTLIQEKLTMQTPPPPSPNIQYNTLQYTAQNLIE
ncbi:hypothetical protein T492DRAFT_1016561 [Pavlovales sp. CCMP2436]|nr:hypothetical protein T492DRAFT_1016561 [Pavlovales sp. CCMP2436]